MAAPALHDDGLFSILSHIQSSQDRKAFSQVSRTCWELEACSRTALTLGPGINAASLRRLLTRFRSLKSLSVNYLGWRPTSGPQLGDEALLMIASLCPLLESLSLAFCGFVSDRGMTALAGCRHLSCLRLNFVPRITSRGLLVLAQGCPALESIHLDRCPRVCGSQWLEAVGQRTVEREHRVSQGSSLEETLATPPLLPLDQSPTQSSLASSIPSSTPPSSTASSVLFPLGSPLTPPLLDLLPASPLATCCFSLEGTGCLTDTRSMTKCSALLKKLTVTRCPLVQERDLARLGKVGWEALEELHFEAEETESSHEEDDTLPLAPPFEEFAGDLDLSRLRVLNLKNCPRVHREGLGLVLSRLCAQRKKGTILGEKTSNPPSWGLRELHLVHCPGLNDADMKLLLSTFAHSLQALSLSLVKWLGSLPAAPSSPALARAETDLSSLCNFKGQRTGKAEEVPMPRSHTAQPQAGQQSTRVVTTASLAHIAEHCKGLRVLELVCKDEFASSAKLFEGFADVAIRQVVTMLPALEELRVWSGLHVTEKTMDSLRDQHRTITFLDV